MQIVYIPRFLCRVNSNQAIFYHFRIMTISGQMHVLFDVHFSDFPEMCIPGDRTVINGGKEQARLRVYSIYYTELDIMATKSASQRTRQYKQISQSMSSVGKILKFPRKFIFLRNFYFYQSAHNGKFTADHNDIKFCHFKAGEAELDQFKFD